MKELSGISGSHGFIGSHLLERLPDSIKLGRDGVIPSGLDVIFDCAAFGNMAGHTGDRSEIYNANLFRVIKEFQTIESEKYIYISSSSVMLPVQTDYSNSKKLAEEFLQFQAENDYRIAIVRPGTVIGRGDSPEHLLPKLIDSCINGTKIPFIEEPTHDYIDIEDFVDALLTIKDRAQFHGEIYEVGNGRAVTNLEVKGIVEEVTGKRANTYKVESFRSYDVPNWKLNTERIFSLGWSAKRSIEDTVRSMVDIKYARKNN